MSVDARPQMTHSADEIRQFVRQSQGSGKRVGVVMTMGALHEGHISLVDACTDACDVCIVTIFVNPTQFGPAEDFTAYPRDLEADLRKLTGHAVDFVFAPESTEMYRPEHSTVVQPPAVAGRLEGAHRDGHFQGVCTIVLKLLNVIPADAAYFGQKDYQQCAVIKNMVSDLDVATEIVVCPTIRADDGLARSSRNQYLSADQRTQALAIHRALHRANADVKNGEMDAATIRQQIETSLLEAGIQRIDYVALVDPNTLLPVTTIDSPAAALVACHVGDTRLIDNWILEP